MSTLPAHGWRESVRAFKALGFWVDRESGDHIIMWGPKLKRPIVIPREDDLPMFIVLNNLRTAGVSRETYRKHL